MVVLREDYYQSLVKQLELEHQELTREKQRLHLGHRRANSLERNRFL